MTSHVLLPHSPVRRAPRGFRAGAATLAFAFPFGLFGQALPTADPAASPPGEEIVRLNPFVVSVARDTGYQATETLAGTRIRTDLVDIGSSISVLTQEFLRDVGGTDNESTLVYALNTEVGGTRGNFSGGITVTGQNTNELDLFANPNSNTRVRGLTSADNTRNYFLSDVPWDGYTVSRVDLQRGPNAILFGLGSPAGVVNTTTNVAEFRNRGVLGAQFDQFGTRRFTFDYNREILEDQLAARVAILHNERKFRQKPAFSDDKRYFGSLVFRPAALNRPGQSFEISANYEHGSIDSNRPRILPPLDQITAWWLPISEGGLDQRTFNPILTRQLTDRNNPNYIPSLGGYRTSGFVFNAITGAWGFTSPSKLGARRPDGQIIVSNDDAAPGPFPQSNSYGRLTVRNFAEWAANAGLPFSDFGGYAPATLTDPSVFDFYNRLMDGPNKGEWTDWDVFDVGVSQSFFQDRIAYNLTAFKQKLDRGQFAALGWQNRIFVDINERNLDGTPNPNVGRAFVEEELRDTNSTGYSNRDAWRAQLFGRHDFSENNSGWIHRFLGEHRLTASYSEENQKRDERRIKGSSLDPASLALFTPTPWIEGGNPTINNAFRYYISGDLRGVSSPAGLNLSGMDMPFLFSQGGRIQVRYFDTTWIAPDTVNPGDFWQSPDPYDTNVDRLTQSANPANYKGWTTREAEVVTFFSRGTYNGMSARDFLTSSARLSEFNVESLTAVWQGYLWDRSIVGTYGYRKDKARSYIWETGFRAGNFRPDTRSADLDPARYNFANPLGDERELETTTRNWSIAAHVNRLLGERDFLPINVSAYYNRGENFSPLAGRIDAFRQPLPPPAGRTEEYSALFATKDRRYSLRATRYRTEITNGTTTGSIGNMWALEQTLGFTANMARDFRSGRVPWANHSSDPAQVARLQNQIIPAWFEFERELRARFPAYVDAWMGPNTPFGTDSNASVSVAAPAGFSYTEDSLSRGWEFELTANPLRNWRVAANAARTTASREEVPGVAFKSVAEFVDDRYMNTDAGLAPIWWHQNDFGGRNFGPYPWNFRPDWLQLEALNGQSTPEVRKWRANLVNSYDFEGGRLSGAGIGGALRWEDKAVIDYAPRKNPDGSNGINLDAPFYSPSNTTVDLWLSYRRKLTANVNWRIQLNVYNVFGKNELVPVTASVDADAIRTIGTITPDTVIPMRPSAFIIREGRSWTISNTIEF